MDAQRSLALRQMIIRHKRWDVIFAVMGLLAIMLGLLTLITLFGGLIYDGYAPMVSPDQDFFSNFPSGRASRAGVLAALVGSAAVMVVTLIVAVPLGIAAGLYLEEYAGKNWFTSLIEVNVSNLASVPSIIFGILGLAVFVQKFALGNSILSAGMTLALLILPVIIVTTREAVRSIPVGIREASYGVGATKWQTVSRHVLPYSMPGILTGVIIGMARAIGETAPLVVVGAVAFITFLPHSPIQPDFPWISFEWLKDPYTVMPMQMFDWVSRPQEDFHALAAGAGLVLIVMTLLMNGLAIYLRYRLRKSIKW